MRMRALEQLELWRWIAEETTVCHECQEAGKGLPDSCTGSCPSLDTHAETVAELSEAVCIVFHISCANI